MSDSRTLNFMLSFLVYTSFIQDASSEEIAVVFELLFA